MSKTKFNLLVVAHPDDETIFFGGLLLCSRRERWKVVCVTDGNADSQGRKRKSQFRRACKELGVSDVEWLGFPDIYERRLDVMALRERLLSMGDPVRVFTHGIIGEYGHPHHQDVSFATHAAFAATRDVFSVAYNCYPDLTVEITEASYRKKNRILQDIYGSETQRFLNLLPATAIESFTRVHPDEVEALYRYFTKGSRPRPGSLRAYASYWPFLKRHLRSPLPRPF